MIKKVCKRSTDFILAAMGLTTLSPLFLLTAILIILDNPGPIFYRQERVGLDGKTFKIYKFRSMIVNAESQLASLDHLNESKDGVLFKIKNADPRVTKVGKWIRKLSIDELPQLINILRGDMSVIGPRALSLRDHNLMPEQYRDRNKVKPGLLCYWQLYTGDRWKLSFDEIYNLDKQYVDRVLNHHWCPGIDLYIMFRAIIIVSKGLNH